MKYSEARKHGAVWDVVSAARAKGRVLWGLRLGRVEGLLGRELARESWGWATGGLRRGRREEHCASGQFLRQQVRVALGGCPRERVVERASS